MKTIEELGISPMPWYVLDDQKTVVCPIGDDISGEVAYCNGGDADIGNARLIAAAPELYEALRDMSMTMANFVCARMLYCTMCEKNGSGCVLSKAKDAIAKASGEEVEQ